MDRDETDRTTRLRSMVLSTPILAAVDVRLVVLVLSLITASESSLNVLLVTILILTVVNTTLLSIGLRKRRVVLFFSQYYLVDGVITVGMIAWLGLAGVWTEYFSIYVMVSALMYMLVADRFLPFLLGPIFLLARCLTMDFNTDENAMGYLVQYLLILVGQVLGIIIAWHSSLLVLGIERAVRDREENIIQQERLEMARELHDNLAKTIHGTEMIATAALVTLRAENSAVLPQMKAIRDACRDAANQTRLIMGGLRNMNGQKVDEEIQLIVDQFTARTGVKNSIQIIGDVEEVRTATQRILVKIVAEAIDNIDRHARASEVQLKLIISEDKTCLTIVDNGVGLPTDHISEFALDGHFGLLGMRERAQSIGGALRVFNIPSGGTKLALDVPHLRD